MKKNLFSGLLLCCVFFSAFAQSAEKSSKLKMKDVPAVVRQSFEQQFPGAKAKWEMEDGNYEASFKDQGKKTSAIFDTNGSIVQTEAAIKISGLPSAAIAYLNTYYMGEKIKDVARIGKANGVINYGASVKDKDLIFDVNGQLMKEEREE